MREWDTLVVTQKARHTELYAVEGQGVSHLDPLSYGRAAILTR